MKYLPELKEKWLAKTNEIIYGLDQLATEMNEFQREHVHVREIQGKIFDARDEVWKARKRLIGRPS